MNKCIALSGDLFLQKHYFFINQRILYVFPSAIKRTYAQIYIIVQRDVYLSTLNLIKSFFSFRVNMSRDENRYIHTYILYLRYRKQINTNNTLKRKFTTKVTRRLKTAGCLHDHFSSDSSVQFQFSVLYFSDMYRLQIGHAYRQLMLIQVGHV